MSRGSFLLTLSNPVQAGTYECRLEDPSVADKCVQNLSVIKLRAHVTVHQVPARLSLLDAQVDVLQQKTEEADSGIKDWQAALASDVSDLRSEIEKQIHADISLRNDVVNLTEKLNDVMTSVTSLTSRVDDLSTENEQLKEKLKQQDNDSVYFSAYITGGDIHASADQVIRFSEVVDNTGNAYNPHTGAFTAPYDGGYMFFVSVDVSASYAWLKVMRNEQKVVEGNDDGSSRQITTGVALTLNVGDTVTVQHCCTRGYIDQGPESVFVGFRVR
nr:hypothetical protein BaRGS_011516 [Batillaria attramentaria]